MWKNRLREFIGPHESPSSALPSTVYTRPGLRRESCIYSLR